MFFLANFSYGSSYDSKIVCIQFLWAGAKKYKFSILQCAGLRLPNCMLHRGSLLSFFLDSILIPSLIAHIYEECSHSIMKWKIFSCQNIMLWPFLRQHLASGGLKFQKCPTFINNVKYKKNISKSPHGPSNICLIIHRRQRN